MALFGRKKKEETVVDPSTEAQGKGTQARSSAPKAKAAAPSVNLGGDLSAILRNPRITEKATLHQEGGVYTFDVVRNATKREVVQAVEQVYEVKPRMVRIVNTPLKRKRSMRSGISGFVGGGKKAYVYLKSGETIAIG